jgi:uncharacterized membrane protein
MRRDTRIVAAFLSTVAAFILGASTLCAWAVAHGASPRWRVLFRVMCHGIERRCLTMFGVPMPICARCTAIYIGLIAGVAVFMLIPMIEERVMRVIVYAAAVPMLIDGLTQATGMRESTNLLRLITGFVAALAFGLWTVTAVEGGRLKAEG